MNPKDLIPSPHIPGVFYDLEGQAVNEKGEPINLFVALDPVCDGHKGEASAIVLLQHTDPEAVQVLHPTPPDIAEKLAALHEEEKREAAQMARADEEQVQWKKEQERHARRHAARRRR